MVSLLFSRTEFDRKQFCDPTYLLTKHEYDTCTTKFKEILPYNLMYDAAMGSDDATSRKPTADDWDAHRENITRLYINDHRSLSDIRNVLQEDHDFSATHRTFKSKLKAWGIRKYMTSQDMAAILRDLTKTHPTYLTQRTSIKTFLVKGRSIELAKVKRYMRRKRLSQSDAESCHNTHASEVGSPTYSQAPASLSRYAAKISPHISVPGEHSWQTIFEKSNYVDLYPFNVPFDTKTTLQYRFMLEYPESSLHKRTQASTSDDLSASGGESQPKPQRSSHGAPTCNNFACPFYKYDPTYYNPQNPDTGFGRRYRSCAGPGWPSIRRLREHLLRAHTDDLNRHPARAQIKQTTRGLPEKQHWIKIYSLLFPSSQNSQTPSPYYDQESDKMSGNQHVAGDFNVGVQSFITYLHTVLPSRIRGELARHLSSQNQVPSADIFDYAIHNCLDQTGSEWLQGQKLQSADHQDLACQQWDYDQSKSWPSCANTPSSGLDQSFAFTDMGIECPTLWNEYEMSVRASTWPAQFQNGNTELASIELGMPSYRSADIMEFSVPSIASVGFTRGSDTAQWSSGDLPDIIVLD